MDFNLSNIMQNWVVNIYLLIIACASVPISKISSKYGLKRTLIIGLVIYIAGALFLVFQLMKICCFFQDLYMVLVLQYYL